LKSSLVDIRSIVTGKVLLWRAISIRGQVG
jgi:hypothetical protein